MKKKNKKQLNDIFTKIWNDINELKNNQTKPIKSYVLANEIERPKEVKPQNYQLFLGKLNEENKKLKLDVAQLKMEQEMLTQQFEKDLISFGNYMMSTVRIERFQGTESEIPIESRLMQVNDSDITNWKEDNKNDN